MAQSQAGLVFQDDFSGGAINLNGSSLDISTTGAKWEAGPGFSADGSVSSGPHGVPGQAAHLDLAIEDGKIYTAQATINNNNASWIAVGFTTINRNWTDTADRNRHTGAGGLVWGLTSSGGQSFFGGIDTGNSAGTASADAANSVVIKLILDNSGATTRSSYFVNGTQVGTTLDHGSKLTYTDDVGGVGFSLNGDVIAGASISDFSLDVKEPGREVVYQQSFTGSGAMTSVGWNALAVRDSTGTMVDISDYTRLAGLGNNYGFFAPHLNVGGADVYDLRVAPGLFYTQAAEIQTHVTMVEQVDFEMIGDPTNASYRVAVKVDGQWYAQAVPTVDSRDNPGATGEFLSAVFEPADFAAATNWLILSNAVIGADEMGLGAAPAGDLSGPLQAVGLYLENASDHMRFDNFLMRDVDASVSISTTDGAAGVSGQVDYDDGGDFGGTQFHVKNTGVPQPYTRKGYVRFDTSEQDSMLESVQMSLTVSTEALTKTTSIEVYGITDQSLDEVILDSSTTWANAPANNTASGSQADLSKAVLLGQFDCTTSDVVGTIKTFSTPALTHFLNNDTNGVVTFILGRNLGDGANLLFAGDTHATYDPPSLDLLAAPPGLYWRRFEFSSASTSNAVLSAQTVGEADASKMVWDTVDQGTGSVDDWAYAIDTGAVSGGGVATGTATNLLPDTLYFARFFGTNGLYEGWSAAKSFSTALITSAQNPVISGATLYSDSVELWWQDQAQNESGYVLERAIEGSGTYTQIAELPANTVEYSDKTVDSSVSYVYRLKAVNTVNDSATEWVEATPSNGYTIWAAGYPAADLSDANADPDLDGFSNRDEYVAGTNPTNPSDKPATELEIAESIVLGKAWLAYGGRYALRTENDRQYAVYYNGDQRTCAAQRLLSETNWTDIILPSKVDHPPRTLVDESSTIPGYDGHNYIVMATDSEGHIHVALNHHANRLTYFRSTNAYDITTLVQVDAMVGDGSQQENRVTYPVFMTAPTGELLFHYRDGGSGNGVEIYNAYNVTNQTWTRFLDVPLISGEGLRSAYQNGPTLGPDGWYHLLWVWRDSGDAATNHDLSYARSRDLIHWETVTGNPLTLPILFGDTGTRVDPVPVRGGIINGCHRFGFDSTNGLVVTYHKFDEAGYTQAYAARFKEGAWVIRQISDWNYRWDIQGYNSLDFFIKMTSPRSYGDGELAMNYRHRQIGSGILVFDEETFAPIRVEPVPAGYPVALTGQESTFPGMTVYFTGDSGSSPDRYVLRHEAIATPGDSTVPTPDDPSDLILYKIATVEASPYSYGEWLTEHALSGSQADWEADLEQDGLNNLVEYALGGNPTNSDAASILPAFQLTERSGSNWFYHVHNERTDDRSLTYAVEATTNLISNDWKTNGVEFVGEVAFSNVWKTVTNQIPTLGKEQQFIRLKVELE